MRPARGSVLVRRARGRRRESERQVHRVVVRDVEHSTALGDHNRMWLHAQRHDIPFRLLEPKQLPEGCSFGPFCTEKEAKPCEWQCRPTWSATTLHDGALHAAGYARVGRPPWSTMNNCTVVVPVEGDGRRLRIKQYHALDYGLQPTHCAMIPPTGSYTAPNARRIPGPRRLFELQGPAQASCGWLGVDYAGCDCAQVLLHGTMVEARVTLGSFSDAELIALLSTLEPVEGAKCVGPRGSIVEEDRDRGAGYGEGAAGCCLADTVYCARHPTTEHAFLVPSSLFAGMVSNVGQPRLALPRWLPAALAPGTAPGGRFVALPPALPAPDEPSWTLDSVCHLGEPETFSVYRRHHAALWVRQVRTLGPSLEACPWPPLRGAYPCLEREGPTRRTVEGLDAVYTLSCTAEAGPHEAAFAASDGGCVLLHASPQVGMDVTAFLMAVAAVVASVAPAAPQT